MRLVVRAGRWTALRLAATLDAVLLDACGTPRSAAGHGPDGRDVLAGRATVPETFRTVGRVPVVARGGPISPTERHRLARAVEREAGRVVVREPPGE